MKELLVINSKDIEYFNFTGDENVVEIQFPLLELIDDGGGTGTLILAPDATTNSPLARIYCPVLREDRGDLEINGYTHLPALEFPELLDVQGNFFVSHNPLLTRIDVPKYIPGQLYGPMKQWIRWEDNALDAASVDGLFNAAWNQGNCRLLPESKIETVGGTNAAPTSASLEARTGLTALGITLTHN